MTQEERAEKEKVGGYKNQIVLEKIEHERETIIYIYIDDFISSHMFIQISLRSHSSIIGE